MWLGLPDPATALFDQVRHDPDSDLLSGLMNTWYENFGSTPTTVRKAVETAANDKANLLDAMLELPVEERGKINPTKLGQFLKRNADRIVNGFKFQQAKADGRNAWQVVSDETPPSPPFTS